jgi:hypothetical protein
VCVDGHGDAGRARNHSIEDGPRCARSRRQGFDVGGSRAGCQAGSVDPRAAARDQFAPGLRSPPAQSVGRLRISLKLVRCVAYALRPLGLPGVYAASQWPPAPARRERYPRTSRGPRTPGRRASFCQSMDRATSRGCRRASQGVSSNSGRCIPADCVSHHV